MLVSVDRRSSRQGKIGDEGRYAVALALLSFLASVGMLQFCTRQRWSVSHNACASTKVIFGWLRQCGSSRSSQSFKSSMRDESDSLCQRLDKVGPRRQAGSHEKFVTQPVLP